MPVAADALRCDGSVAWGALPAPAANLRCCVVMPARNEALLLPRALRALAVQTNVAGQYEVLVLANNCSDDTAAQGHAFAQQCTACAIHVVSVQWPADIANVGRARKALFDQACGRVGQAGRRGVLASTDADSHVAPDWLSRTLAAIDAGADAVGGRILADPDAMLPMAAQRVARLDDVYRRARSRLESLADPDTADPWPRHHQHFGASLAITADCYSAIGGQPLVPYLEDEAIVQSLRLHDRRLRHCPDVRVHTSARLDGRAEVGLSWQLRQWSGEDTSGQANVSFPQVPDPLYELAAWTLRRQLRQLWVVSQDDSSAMVHKACQTWLDSAALSTVRDEVDWLRALTSECPLAERLQSATSFGRFWAAVQSHRQAALPGRRVPMDQALTTLRRLAQAVTAAPPPASGSRQRNRRRISTRLVAQGLRQPALDQVGAVVP